MRRLSDVVGARVVTAIGLLPIPEETRAKITWELVGTVLPAPGGPVFTYVLTLCVPVPFTANDFEAPFKPLGDANATQEEINETVRALYAEAEQGWTIRGAASRAGVPAERTPGGLFKG
jgi:hypothetical protein